MSADQIPPFRPLHLDASVMPEQIDASFAAPLTAAAATAAGPRPTDAADMPDWLARLDSTYNLLLERSLLASRVYAWEQTYSFDDSQDSYSDRRRFLGVIIGIINHPTSKRQIVALVDPRKDNNALSQMSIDEARELWIENRAVDGAFQARGVLKSVGIEEIRTPQLDTEQGALITAEANALIGQLTVVGRFMEEFGDRSEGRSMRIAAFFKAATGTVTPAATEPAPAPAPTAATPDAPASEMNADLLSADPQTPTDVAQLAQQHFGMPSTEVKRIAAEALGADKRAETPADCKKVWTAIVAAASPTAA